EYPNGMKAIAGPTVNIKQGEFVYVVGPSGPGKSTFIKTLNLMLQMVPNVKVTGDMIYNGRKLLKEKTDAAELKAQIGMV
ncbi:ATP-binding cassette domain-containing protein, partial [Lysinibacillus sp. D4A1_S13]|uniref:ATP-binding cassette domain-containing protein n=1 Tax=Lysinibacillus sp. D4A1_S13 TaxID=2941228 RepID=UPI0020C0BE06